MFWVYSGFLRDLGVKNSNKPRTVTCLVIEWILDILFICWGFLGFTKQFPFKPGTQVKTKWNPQDIVWIFDLAQTRSATYTRRRPSLYTMKKVKPWGRGTQSNWLFATSFRGSINRKDPKLFRGPCSANKMYVSMSQEISISKHSKQHKLSQMTRHKERSRSLRPAGALTLRNSLAAPEREKKGKHGWDAGALRQIKIKCSLWHAVEGFSFVFRAFLRDPFCFYFFILFYF